MEQALAGGKLSPSLFDEEQLRALGRTMTDATDAAMRALANIAGPLRSDALLRSSQPPRQPLVAIIDEAAGVTMWPATEPIHEMRQMRRVVAIDPAFATSPDWGLVQGIWGTDADDLTALLFKVPAAGDQLWTPGDPGHACTYSTEKSEPLTLAGLLESINRARAMQRFCERWNGGGWERMAEPVGRSDFKPGGISRAIDGNERVLKVLVVELDGHNARIYEPRQENADVGQDA